ILPGKIARKLAPGAPEVHLESERVLPRPRLQGPLQRCIRHEASIPVALALDFDGRKARRQRPARHNVLWTDCVRRRVETGEVTRADMDGPNAEPHRPGVDPIEIDEAFQRPLKRRDVVKALRTDA